MLRGSTASGAVTDGICGWLGGMIKRTFSVLALGGLLVAGCGAGTTVVERDSASPSPTISTPIEPTEERESPAVTVPSETPSMDLPPEPSDTIPEPPVEVPTPVEPDETLEVPATTPASMPASTPATSGGAWAPMEISVQTAADATKLVGTSSDFQAFVAQRVGIADASGCTSEFTILAFHPDGYAAGQESAPGCGGSQNIWGKQGGQWETLMVMQSVVECTDMANNGIPTGLPDIPCLDSAGNITDW